MRGAALVYPLGFPVEVTGPAQPAIEIARESWGSWERIFDEPALKVHVEVCEGPKAAKPGFAGGADTFAFVAGRGNRAEFSLNQRRVAIRISRATLADHEGFRYHFLEAAVLTALDTLFFTPAHAACITRGRSGILLCGDSGAGKSSLAYAAARRGWTFVSEDAVHAVNEDPALVMGNPAHLTLRPDAPGLFPELSGCPARELPNGKLGLALGPLVDALPRSISARITSIVFLARRAGASGSWEDYPRLDAIRYFEKYVGWGDPAMRRIVFSRMLAGGARRLVYERLDDAVLRLDELFQEQV